MASGLSASSKKSLSKLESSMARKGFDLGDLIEKLSPQVLSSAASGGGGATEAYTVTGLLATDIIISVSQRVKGAANLPLLGYNTQVNDGLTGVYSADPGINAIIDVAFVRPA